MSEVSAVLFANDHRKVARFYEHALGMMRFSADADHTVLNCRGFELVVHQIPKQSVGPPANPEVPQRREGGAIRLDYPIDSIQGARTLAGRFGGHVDESPPAWVRGDADFRLGHDPEGNVFRVIERAPDDAKVDPQP